MMNTNHDDLATGVNGRLRPRKQSIALAQPNKIIRKSERNTDLKTKNSAFNNVNLLDESTDKPCQEFLCLYCNKKFFLKQSLSQHLRRTHFSTFGQDHTFNCNLCDHKEIGNNAGNTIVKHMIDCHPHQYFACDICNTRFGSACELTSHRSFSCENQKLVSLTPYKLRPKHTTTSKKERKSIEENVRNEESSNGTGFSGIVISCELKSTQAKDVVDIENSITTNLILPRGKNLADSSLLEKNAIILLDDIQWSKSLGSQFAFRSAETEQILSRLGVVHRSPKTSECTRRDWYRIIDETTKFEKCFDTGFYSKVASNVQENLTKFLDGSFTRLPSDFDNVMKTRKAKNNVIINTVEGFPILLASQQYSRIPIDSYMPRAIAPKHKWKWDNIENDNLKNLDHQDREKRDSHANNCIVTLVSSLDMWTQLCMRRKYEAKFTKVKVDNKKIDKQNTISNELKEIIESREIPTTSAHILKYTNRPVPPINNLDFPASLGLVPAAPKFDMQPAVLSGEWARPRCYVCCACGEQTRDNKALSSHISSRHPNAQIAHYEIVGEPLLNADILKHLYVPPSQVFNRIRPLRGSKECTKCKKPVSFEELHQHMLECAGDTPVVRRRCRYRPFGVRRRRPRLPDNRIRKRIRKDIRNGQNSQKTRLKPRNKLRTEVGDAETIRKMLADLPAKRHRVTINPINPAIRSRKIHEKRQLLLRRRVVEDAKNERSTKKLGVNIKLNKVDGGHASDGNVQARKKGMPLQNSLQKVVPSKRRIILKRTVKKNSTQQSVNESQSTSNPETSESNSKQTESSASNGNISEELSLSNKSDKICFNNNGDNARACSNRDNGNSREERQSRSNEPSRNNFPQNNGPTQNAPLKHSIARLTSVDEASPKYVKYPYVLSQENYIITTQNIQYMPTGQPLFFENEIAANKLDKPPLCEAMRKLDVCGYQKNKPIKPKKGLNDCIAMLKNKLVDTNQNQRCSFSPTLSVIKENVMSEGFRTEFSGNEKDFGSLTLLQTHTIPLAHTNVPPSITSTPLDLSGKSESLDSTYGTSLDLSVKSTSPSNETYVTLDLSTKSQAQNSTFPDKKINSTHKSNVSHTSNDASLNLSTKTPFKSTNSNLIDLTENSTKMLMAIDENATKRVSVIVKEGKISNKTNMALNVQKESNARRDGFEKVTIETDIKKSVDDKRNLEKSASKQQHTKFIEKALNQKPVYDPTLKIPQYKIRAGTDSKNNDKETEKQEPKQTPSMEAGPCNIELLPKEIVDILGTMPVQHRNKLLNVLPQVFAKTVKQLKLAVDLNITKESITSPNKSEIATQTSNNLSEPTCPPEFLNVDTDKFLIDPVTGDIIERTNPENETSECLHNEKITNLMIEDKKEEVKQELSSLNINTDLCRENIDPTATTILANSVLTKQKTSNDQTASLRAVRIKSANEKLKSSKSDCILSPALNEEKLNFEDTNNTISMCSELKNNDMEMNVKTTLAIQQFEVTSTQQNSCSYKQLSPTFVPDLQKSLSPVSGPTLESNIILDISNSDEDTHLQSNKVTNKVTSDSLLHTLECISPNTVTIELTKTGLEQINHEIEKSIMKSPCQSVSKLDQMNTLSSNNTNEAYKFADASIVLTDIDSSLKSSILKSSTQESLVKQNHDVALCELDNDDDPEDDISLATILKQKIANQEKNDSSDKTKFSDSDTVSRKSARKGKKQTKANNVKPPRIRHHTIGSMKKSKNVTNVANILSDTCNESKQEENMEVVNNLDCQSDLKRRSQKKKSRFNAETNKIRNFDGNKEIDQMGICQVNTEQSKLVSDVQKNCDKPQFIKSGSESKENEKEDHNSFKVTIAKKSQEEQLYQSKESTNKEPFGNCVTQCRTVKILKDDNIVCKKRMDLNKTAFTDCITATSSVKNDLHKVSNISNSRVLLSVNEDTNKQCDSVINENAQLLSENDCNIINSNQINIDIDVSNTNIRYESQNTLNCNLPTKKVKTRYTIEEIIKPRDVNHSLEHTQSDLCEQEKQLINLNSMEETTAVNETDFTKESLIRDNEKKIATSEICRPLEFEESNDVPLRRSKRGKSFHADSYVTNLGDYTVSDISNLQHKTPLTKKQVIFSKLLLDVENQFRPSNDLCHSSKRNTDVPNESLDSNLKAETTQSITKPTKRKLSPIVKKKMKRKKTIEEIVQARSTLLNSEKTVNADYVALSSKDSISNELCLPIVTQENDQTCDSILDDSNNISDNGINDLCNESKSQSVSKYQMLDHNTENSDQQKSNKKTKKGIVINPSSTPENSEEKHSTRNVKENTVVSQQTIDNDHSQVTISIPRLNIGPSMSESSNKLPSKSDPHKYSKSDTLEPDDTLNKSKVDNIASPNVSSAQLELNSQNGPPINILTAFDKSLAEELQLLEIQLSQNIRMKSNVVESYSDIEFEDSYYDFYDDPKGENNFTNGSTSSPCTESINDAPKKLNKVKKAKKKKSKKSTKEKMCSVENGEYSKFDDNPLPNGKEDLSSDSDDSIRSDVPLKIYAEEIAKCGGESSGKAMVSNVENKNDDVKDKENKDFKNKKSPENSDDDNVANSVHTEEELRSEQFMESFGFFSERKPRKSNLLATKKISETFHNISNENDDIFLPAKNKSTKKPNSTESNKKNKESDSGNSKNLKEKNKKTGQSSISKKPQKKRHRRRRPRNYATYCIFCRKDYERLDNYLRHRITLLHISRVSEIEMQYDTIAIEDMPNYLVAYKHYVHKLKKKREKMARDKKRSGRDSPIEPFVLPTLDEALNKPGTSKSRSNKGKAGKGKGKKSEIKKSKGKKSSGDSIEANISEASKQECNAAEIDKSQIKVQEHNKLEADKPSCSSQDISRRGLSNDEALFLDCCELLKESHKTENLNAETSHAIEKGKEPFEVKSFECGSVLNNDEKSEDEIDPITAKSILESEEVRNLEKDLISGLKEAVSNASSSLVSSSNSSKEFARDKEDIDSIANCSENGKKSYTEEKSNEISQYSKKVDIYSDKKLKETAHCSKNTEAVYLSEKNNEKIRSSKNRKNKYSKVKANEITNCLSNVDFLYSKDKSNEADCSENSEKLYFKEKPSDIPHSKKNANYYLHETTYEVAHCSKHANILHSKYKLHPSKSPDIIHPKEKININPYNSKSTEVIYSQGQSYEVAHCSTDASFVHLKHKPKEIAHSSKRSEISYLKENINETPQSSKNVDVIFSQNKNYEISYCSKNAGIVHSKQKTNGDAHCSSNSDIVHSKEKNNGIPQVSTNTEVIGSSEKKNEIAHCSKNADTHLKHKGNDTAHHSSSAETVYSKEIINGNPLIRSKNAEITYPQEKSYDILHSSKNSDIAHSERKTIQIAHSSKNSEIMLSKGKNNDITHSCKNAEIVYLKDKANEGLHNPKNSELVYSKQSDEIAVCSKNAVILYSKEKICQITHSPKNEECLYSKERITDTVDDSSKYTESEHFQQNSNETEHNSINVDLINSKEKRGEVVYTSKNRKIVYSKDRITDTVDDSSKYTESEPFQHNSNETEHNSINVDLINSKEKRGEVVYTSKNRKIVYSKDTINETGRYSKNPEFIHSAEITKTQDICNSTESICVKDKNKEKIHESLDDTAQNIKHSEQIKPNATPETKLMDIFEDKFDIIKRKCRSQAAAAKNLERNLEIQNSHQAKRKSDKKVKSKKNSKKNVQGPIVTKGALKEFDGIKVSIPTSDIKMSVFAPAFSDSDQPPKKKKKNSSKKKKEKSDSSFNTVLDLCPPDHSKDICGTAKQTVDVYEFMDNEDTDMFDFRSKRLDRFKNTNKELGYCSKTDSITNKDYENSQQSSISGSDVDDFVYMSDDYVCSADETENSLLSCELGTVSKSSSESKKNGSSTKRKDSTEKNAVMGKIFKHNAVRNERKNYTKAKETKCAKANLDQLFDSLLENKPNPSLMSNESVGSKQEALEVRSGGAGGMVADESVSEAGPSRETRAHEEDESETGVARQRARRKCTVGKQNVLAESWSSESEGESGDSEGGGGGRRRAARPQGPSRRARRITFKADDNGNDNDNESRVCSNVSASGGRRDKRSRSELAYYWSSGGEEDARVEQHGWIVGDSHKKLVTMLAHAKGRRRDDRRHYVE